MKILIDIERLVLSGLGGASGEASLIRKALERELVKVLSAWPPRRKYHDSAVPRLAAPNIRLSVGERPGVTGTRIGRAIGQTIVGGCAVERRNGSPESSEAPRYSERGSTLTASDMDSVAGTGGSASPRESTRG